MKYIIAIKKSISELMLILIKTFINQSNIHLNRFRFCVINNKKQHLISVYILLFVWILGLNILNKAFVSLLLKTFFKLKPTLTVETLDDIVSNPDLLIAGKDYIHEIKLFKPEIYDILERRITKYEEMLGIGGLFERPLEEILNILMKDIFNRRAVYLVRTIRVEIAKKLYFDLNLMSSPVKYCQRFEYYYISKSYLHYKPIHRLYV